MAFDVFLNHSKFRVLVIDLMRNVELSCALLVDSKIIRPFKVRSGLSSTFHVIVTFRSQRFN